MVFLSALLGGLCIGCISPNQPTAVQRAGVVAQLAIAPAAGDGCARLHVRVGPGSTATLTTVDEGSACRADELEVRVDSALVFDAVTGVLRLPIVIRNLGTIPMGVPARLTFIADSAQLFDNDGNLIPGKPDIVAHNADSANATGRIGVWRYDTYLAPNGQTQVLGAAATSQTRWLELRATDWKNSVKISLSASAVEPSPNAPPVPAVAPDTIPRGLFADSNLVVDPDVPVIRYVKRLVSVLFKSTATLAERQAAVAAVGGVVVGGARIFGSDGYYLIHLASDTSVRGPKNAAALLQTLPQVDFATIEIVSARLQYLRPRDGDGWRNWRVGKGGGSTVDTTWALEDIAAPLAWGCTVGLSRPPIAFVDQYFFAPADLSPNINTQLSVGLNYHGSSTRARAHGTRLTSIAGARGNNDAGMTGLLWHTDLRVYDLQAIVNATSDTSQSIADISIFTAIARAAGDGARVISLAAAEVWNRGLGPENPVGVPANIALAEQTKSRMVNLLTRLRGQGHTPLLVMAAGNRNLDAYWSRFPAAAGDSGVAGQILVVGASTPARVRWTINANEASAFGPLVGVYAPGEDVYGMDGNSAIVSGSGTSFAAPFATALAGMLLDIDPRLSAQELKTLIIAGADSARLPSDQVRVLNAYASLKLAAKRSGSAACANRVWLANDSIYVQRESTNEAVFYAPPPALGVTAGHGSVLASGSTYIAFRNGSWIATTETLDPYDQGSPERSPGGYSHDRDSLAFVEPDPNGGWGYGLFVTVLHSDTALIPTVQRTLTTVPMSQLGGPSDCAAENASNNQCIEAGDFGVIRPSTNSNTDNETPVLAYAPLGDEILVAVPHLSNIFGPGSSLEFTDCPTYGTGYRCKSFDVRRRVDSTVV